MQVDTTKWSGEGTFTQLLLDRLTQIDTIDLVRVEDAPASRSEADYNFISNEVFVRFTTRNREEAVKRFGFLPGVQIVREPAMTMAGLQEALEAIADVGESDYADDSMLQYLRTERIVPPYQTRGYKLVELVRIYETPGPR